MLLTVAMLCLLLAPVPAAIGKSCSDFVFRDDNGDGHRQPGEPGIGGVMVSDGITVSTTGDDGRYRLPWRAAATVFVIKPAGYRLPERVNGLPDFWFNLRENRAPKTKYGGLKDTLRSCRGFALQPAADDGNAGDVLLFSDTQVKNLTDVGYYARSVIEPLLAQPKARLGLTTGDVVNDDLSLYPAMNAQTRRLGVPWLHIPGNHDLDFDVASDADSLRSYRNTFGPDTFAAEYADAVFVGLDDVIYLPGQSPSYQGGLREDQFAFLKAYLPTLGKDRLLVIGVHIPFFEEGPRGFRVADRERLFALLQEFPHVLLLSGHTHNQRHYYHGAASGWHGAQPLHEYNMGAICGSYWSGVKDADGIPDGTMSDGTPKGYARLKIGAGSEYALSWHPSHDPQATMTVHAPRVLRQGAYPAWGVFANVYMGQDDTRVEYRVDGGEWKPMRRVLQPDPALLAENMADDLAEQLRGFDRSPEADPSQHLWRGALPTTLAEGEHEIEVRAFDRWQGEQRGSTHYRLQTAEP
ncbi:calcineurin-like phosphoesterase C-terminal domain-containing protein [Pseudoxanthomonas kalamensis]|uniref:calcineurin-like phosphoesterase C-terminal domain-containing protein n=1 Tax=Pseudoxanthomonas kalamensis TaxID=289483 RepID=UPI003CCDBE8D